MRIEDLDDFDRAILRELMRDGRMTNAELAERVHLSPSACLRRVRALEESGVIAGYVALLDADKAGLAGAAFVFVTLEQQGRAMLDAFERDVRRHPEITECYLLAGAADYLLRVVFRDFARLRAHPHRDPDAVARRLAGAVDLAAADRQEDDRSADLTVILPGRRVC